MNYKKLGNTDIKVSTICLGTMTWGEQNTQEEGFEQMDFALDQGVNFWDTAELFAVPPKEETFGHTEIIIGNWFEKTKNRDKVILATKVAGQAREYIRGSGNNYTLQRMTEALNDSLKRLKTANIDLYQLHWPERNTHMFGRLGYTHNENEDWNKFEEVLNKMKTEKVQKINENFDDSAQKEFLKGAKIAYETIITDFSDNDNKITASKPLLSKEIFNQFNEALKERSDRGHYAEITFIGINSAVIKEHKKIDKILNVTVDFIAEVITCIKDKDKKIISGDPEKVKKIYDTWVFSRDVTSANPNWQLVNTLT